MNMTKPSPAWARAWERFSGGWGGEPDLSDPTDRHEFLRMLEECVREDVEAEIVTHLRGAAARIEAAGKVEP